MIKKLVAMLLFVLPLVAQAQTKAAWMRYPSISPDGKTIAFSYKGDIYTVPSSGGEAELLTTHPSYDYSPVWSHDGQTIAFASDRFGNFDVFTISANGGPANRLTYHSANQVPSSFTPDDKAVLFDAHMYDAKDNVQFPYGLLTELYQVSVDGGRPEQILSVPAIGATYNKAKNTILYYDRKGYEDNWRKHHESAVTRDIWTYDVRNDKHTQLTTYAGEDRYPVFSADEKSVFYITEQFGTANVASFEIANPTNITQVSDFKLHPVRFLTAAHTNNGTVLCYGYDGRLFTQKVGEKAKEVVVTVRQTLKDNPFDLVSARSGAQEMALSPNGKEVAFILRGDVFVTSLEYSTTKQITKTPEQERSVSFSPEGDAILYAGERDGSWNLYQTKLKYPEEKYFNQATLLDEEVILASDKETFQPSYSPDGKEVAFLEERTALRVINLDSKKVRTVLDGKYNYSYSDGDQYYEWSPDSKWLLVNFFENGGWMYPEVGLVKATGKEDVINLTNSGYSDGSPRWMMGGKAIIWFTDRQGYRSHGSWGAESDVYGMFLTQETYDSFNLSKEEAEYQEEIEKEDAKADEDKEEKKDDKKDDKEESKDIEIQLKGIEDRVERLTINSSNLSDAVLTPEGDKLYYLASFEGGHDLWVRDFKEGGTKLLAKLGGGYSGSLQIDKDGKNLYMVSGGTLVKYTIANNQQKRVSFSTEYELDAAGERDYMFEHVWRQAKKKFYVEDLHGAPWDKLKTEYKKYLPHINNNYDYAEMLSELLGELNGSHTGARYYHRDSKGDRTATFAAFYDTDFKGDGLKITEIINNGPLDKADSEIKVGHIIEKIDGVTITPDMNYYKLLNRKAGEKVLVSVFDPKAKKRWNETIKPISFGALNGLLYDRWVESRRKEVERLSDGKVGYVHVQGMNSPSFRTAYSEIFGRYRNAEAIIVDTRFNGGGWLHDDLATMLKGERYADFVPRGQYIGSEPINKWYKPSAVLVSEGNYSDAYGFPFTYKALDVGPLVGMPVPGTMTAVWWETLQDNSLVFGIPQVGMKDMEGDYLENKQIEPDYKVDNEKSIVVKGRDQQLEKAVQVLLDEVKK